MCDVLRGTNLDRCQIGGLVDRDAVLFSENGVGGDDGSSGKGCHHGVESDH
jgi:hypothetical protein